MRKSLMLLALCQALGMTISSALITTGGLVGEALAPDPRWATFPTSMQFAFTMLATLPASLLMQRKGRRYGFLTACVFVIFSGIGGAVAIYYSNFAAFVASFMGFGVAIGFFQYFRFAAIDVVPDYYASRAVSWVLAGGLLAAFLGPNLAAQTHLIDIEHPFLVTMLSTIPVAIMMLLLLRKMNFPAPAQAQTGGMQRSIKTIVCQPTFIVAAVCSMISYSMMTLLMTATPLAMKGHGFQLGQTAFIIQWHLVGMFAPSFFSGMLIAKVGVLRVMLTGVLAYLLVVVINMQSNTMMAYWLALVLLGIGWNFLFVGATTLLHETWQPAEKGTVQGINDTLVFSMSAIAAMSAGVLYAKLGWQTMNLVSLPFTAIAGGLIVYLMLRRRADAPVLA